MAATAVLTGPAAATRRAAPTAPVDDAQFPVDTAIDTVGTARRTHDTASMGRPIGRVSARDHTG